MSQDPKKKEKLWLQSSWKTWLRRKNRLKESCPIATAIRNIGVMGPIVFSISSPTISRVDMARRIAAVAIRDAEAPMATGIPSSKSLPSKHQPGTWQGFQTSACHPCDGGNSANHLTWTFCTQRDFKKNFELMGFSPPKQLNHLAQLGASRWWKTRQKSL